MSNKLTAIVIAKNEEAMLPACLETLTWCHKIIVVDCASTDKTAEIAESFGARVIGFEHPSFAKIREKGLSLVETDWLIYVDADERVTPALAKEIMLYIEQDEADALVINRDNVCYGQRFAHGNWQHDQVIRVFRKSAIKGWQGEIHESPIFHGKKIKLVQKLIHLTHRSTQENLFKSANWTIKEAKLLASAPQTSRVTFKTIMRKGLMEFYRRAFKYRGRKDGLAGLIEALVQAINRMLVYIQVWELQQKPSLPMLYEKGRKTNQAIVAKRGKNPLDFMKIVFYSPYLPKHSGGGEKYLFDCMRVALKNNFEVYLAISSKVPLNEDVQAKIQEQYEQFLNYSLAGLKIIATPIGTKAGFLKKLFWTRQFDRFYYQTDGSLFFSLAKKNILHIQVPLKLDKTSFLERLKLINWRVKNSNSEFTKKYIQRYWLTKVDYVHYPLVDLNEIPSQKEAFAKKEKIILNVGRFFKQLHSKRQDVLVKIFKELLEKYPKESKGWQLVLIGFNEDSTYSKKIAAKIKGLPIKIFHNLSRGELIDYYQRASIYWHATGFEINEDQSPEKVEHFGISTIEAMAAYAVPVAIKKGGQKEILTGDLAENLWETEKDCLEKTIELIKDQEKTQELALTARERSLDFSQDIFEKILLKMIK